MNKQEWLMQVRDHPKTNETHYAVAEAIVDNKPLTDEQIAIADELADFLLVLKQGDRKYVVSDPDFDLRR